MDDLVPQPGNVTDGAGRLSWEIKVIGEFPELRRRQIKVELPRNRSREGKLVRADADRRQTHSSGGRSGLLALTGSGSNYQTLVVAGDSKTQLDVLRNDHRRFTRRV
jgi:hypothetical protein